MYLEKTGFEGVGWRLLGEDRDQRLIFGKVVTKLKVT
jgi:hypothetical protein